MFTITNIPSAIHSQIYEFPYWARFYNSEAARRYVFKFVKDKVECSALPEGIKTSSSDDEYCYIGFKTRAGRDRILTCGMSKHVFDVPEMFKDGLYIFNA